MATIVEEIPKQLKRNTEENISSLQLEPKPFFWDSIIFFLASTIFGLSVSGVIVDFFKSNNSSACFSELENRAQYTYINIYCQKYLPIVDYFIVALVIHAVVLVAPHYLWKVFFSAQFDFFFSHAAKIETLLERDTGEYPHKNYSIVDYLEREFCDQKIILTAYIAKLLLQILFVLASLAINIAVFSDIDFDITFECLDNQLFGNVTCAYPRKLFINVLQVVDYFLLAVAFLVLGFSLYRCLIYNHSKEDEIAQFCYDSCIDAKFYQRKPLKKWLNWHQMKNDFNFLLALLLATNTGFGRVFKSILINRNISQKFNADVNACHYQGYIKKDDTTDGSTSINHSGAEIENDTTDGSTSINHSGAEIENDTTDGSAASVISRWLLASLAQTLQQSTSINHSGAEIENSMGWKIAIGNPNLIESEGEARIFPRLIYEIYEKARGQNTSMMGIVDIACGYHSHLFDIAKRQQEGLVVPIILGPYSRNQTKGYKCEDHGGINVVKMPTNLVDLSLHHKKDFAGKIHKRAVHESVKGFGLVIVGPLDDENKVNTVSEILRIISQEDTMCFKDHSILLILRPLQVEGNDISRNFDMRLPKLTELWHEIYLQKHPARVDYDWLREKRNVVSFNSHSIAEITVPCGGLTCKYELKIFHYGTP